MMTNIEIQQFLSEIIAEHQGDIRNLELEIGGEKGRHTYQFIHNNLECKIEVFERETAKFSRIKIGNFKVEYPEGTENYNLITELLLVV
jgi:hypothetical protein